jgi:3-phosphoshikimate 1-carboxyvinyltransferase
VPGDVSSAAFLVVAGLVLPDAFVHIEDVLLNPRRTAFLDVLRRMGAHIETGIRSESPEPVGWIEARASRLGGAVVSAAEVPALIDEVPILAVAGALASGTTIIRHAQELRVKETDRIAAIAHNLRIMGAQVIEMADGLEIHGPGS